MTFLNRAVPHLLTFIALAACGLLLYHYDSTLAAHKHMAEANYFSQGWDGEVISAAYDAIAAGETLPCPAYAHRNIDGRHGTYVLTAEVTRGEPTSALDHPTPTCEPSAPEILFRLTAGSTKYPRTLEGQITINMTAAEAEPGMLLRPQLRPTQPVAFTAVPENP